MTLSNWGHRRRERKREKRETESGRERKKEKEHRKSVCLSLFLVINCPLSFVYMYVCGPLNNWERLVKSPKIKSGTKSQREFYESRE